MKFTVSSSDLLRVLLSVSRVVATKSSLPILENFLFVLHGDTLEVTASDSETTLKTSLRIENSEEEGEIAVPAKLLTDSLKEFPDQPICFSTKPGESILEISWASGESQLPFFPAIDYPEIPVLDEASCEVSIPADTLLDSINNTIYATAEEEIRPVMNGIFFDMTPSGTTFVASDAHKLVCFNTSDVISPVPASFILHKKPANVLKGLLSKVDGDIAVRFDNRNAYFKFNDTVLVCRLIEGKFPAYRSVIPKNNENLLVIDRIELLNAVRRVAVCSNQATNHIKLKLSFNRLAISAQDMSFSIAAHEQLSCQYNGDEMEIGFKSTFLAEILNNVPYEQICIKLADPCRAILIVPAEGEDHKDEICALLMPIMINS